ncbi:MAG: hypothetical protein ABJD53_17840 [Gammaproteobacteria bacterium]
MPRFTRQHTIFAIGAILCGSALAQQFDGKLPLYPHGKNLNDMPATAVAAGVPMVAETVDSVDIVDGWYKSNAPSCTRLAQSGGVKFQCPGGSIMIYQHEGKTQIAFVPAMF